MMSAQQGDRRPSNEEYVFVDAADGDGWVQGVASAGEGAAEEALQQSSLAAPPQLARAEPGSPGATTEAGADHPAMGDPSG